MKSRKKKSLPVRAKRYQKKRDIHLDYNHLESRQMLAADSLPTINFVGSTDLINLTKPMEPTAGVDVLRSQLNLGQNESLKLQKSWADALGFEHFKYQQYFNNIPVEGSNYTLHLRDSQIVSMSGDRVALVNPVSEIRVNSQNALQSAMDFIGAERYAWQDPFTSELLGFDGPPDGELVYITADDGASIPAYKFDLYALDLGTRDYVYVNANTAAIEASESRIRHADVDATGMSHYNGIVPFIADEFGGMVRLRQVTDGVETYDNQMGNVGDHSNAIDIVSGTTLFDDPTQFSGVSAHWGAENTLEMFQTLFGRDSYDDEGATLISYVNVSEDLVNAFWDGSVMQYGEGDGTSFGPLVEIDIVGHEITHGVTEYSANLVYAYEPGALNESFSDIFGEVVENFATGTNDWLSGANADLLSDGIRSFIDPNSDNQPDTYLGDLWWTSGGDNGGVHFNSGVQNKWFYILSVGEAGRNDNNDRYDVTGIGIDDAAQIAYRNLTTYLGRNSQYQDARDGAVQAAIDLFGEFSEQHLATDAAWAAVGLYSQDIAIDSMTDVVPGSMIFSTEYTSYIPDILDRGFVMSLDAGQELTVNVEAENGIAPTIKVVDENYNVVATAGPSGFRSSIDSLPITAEGEYRIGVDTVNGQTGTFNIRFALNAIYEGELVQSFDNGELGSAQDIEASALKLDSIAAERLGVIGEFEISEIPAFVSENFESGVLDGSWTTHSTQADGRIRVLDTRPAGEGQFALYMDTTASGYENLNEAIWTVDLSSLETPFLNFYHASFNDENTILPDSFNGTINGDGVSVSDDGITWYTILTNSVTDPGDWNQFSFNLADFASTVGIDLNSTFQVKFQQYDDDILGADGRAFDGISISTTSESEDWYSFDLNAGEAATIAAGKTLQSGYVNVELYNSDGDLVMAGTPSQNVAGRINQYVATATDTYFARLVGSSTSYGLVVTRGAEFDTGSGESTPQDVSLPQSVIGHVEATARELADPDSASDRQVLDNFFAGVTLSNNITGGSVYAVRSSFEAPSGVRVFGTTPTGAAGWQEGVNELRADFDAPQDNVSILVGSQDSGTDIGFIRAYDVNGFVIDETISGALLPGETEAISVSSNGDQKIAYIVAGGWGNDLTPLDDLKFDAMDDANDYYAYQVGPNQFLNVTASFPGTGRGLPQNRLIANPPPMGGLPQNYFRMDLLDSNGDVVASSLERLGASSSLRFYSEYGGTYRVRVGAITSPSQPAGDYHLGFSTETPTGISGIGDPGLGVAVSDSAQGSGYLMYSTESVFTRFAANPPAAGNADRVIAVRYDGASRSWQYNDDLAWHAFAPVDGDRLLAKVDFTTDKVHSLEGLAGLVHGIQQGFAKSDLQFNANLWNGSVNLGEFEVKGTHFFAGDQIVNLGPARSGITSDDLFTGSGYMMYSEEAVQTRFAANPPYAAAAPHVITVRYDSATSAWQYHNNVSWNAFTPVASDRLLADIDFNLDRVTLLAGRSGQVNGIEQGFIKSDLVFTPNRWAGKPNGGEFEFTGTYFVSNQTVTPIGNTGFGIGVHDNASGSGYILFSEENVYDRFAVDPPRADGAEQMVAVRLLSASGTWEYSNNTEWVRFIPVESDRLIAMVDYDADTITAIEGFGGNVNGIRQGFFDSDLVFVPNSWDGGVDVGEFQVTGTYFNTGGYSYGIGSLGQGIAVDDLATGTGFLMFSETNLRNRFSTNPPFSSTSSNLIAVRFTGGNWEYNDNYLWHAFVPVTTDRLIAAIDFDLDTITSLAGANGNYEGIYRGFFTSDLTFVADSWNGKANDGEFQVFGTSFIA